MWTKNTDLDKQLKEVNGGEYYMSMLGVIEPSLEINVSSQFGRSTHTVHQYSNFITFTPPPPPSSKKKIRGRLSDI